MARRIKSLHFNSKEGQNVQAHREHRSKRGRCVKKSNSLAFRMYKLEKKYGKSAKYFK